MKTLPKEKQQDLRDRVSRLMSHHGLTRAVAGEQMGWHKNNLSSWLAGSKNIGPKVSARVEAWCDRVDPTSPEVPVTRRSLPKVLTPEQPAPTLDPSPEMEPEDPRDAAKRVVDLAGQAIHAVSELGSSVQFSSYEVDEILDYLKARVLHTQNVLCLGNQCPEFNWGCDS